MFRFLLRAIIPSIIFAGATIFLERLGGLPTTSRLGSITGVQLYAWQALATTWWLALASLAATLTRSRSRKRFVSDVISVALFAGAVLAIIAFVFDMRPTALLTSGIIAVTLGLAFQSVLADLLAGIALNAEAPFHAGDRVTIGPETSGLVLQSNWRSVHVHVPDDGLLVVPNQIVAKQRLLNHTAAALPIRASVTLRVAEEHDPRTVIALLTRAALATTGVLDTPAADVQIISWEKREITYELRFFCSAHEERDALRPRVFAQAWAQLALTRLPLDELLRQVGIFEPLSSEELRSLGNRMVSRRFQPGDVVVREGEHGDSMFIVREGALHVLVQGADSRHELARLGAGDCFGEMSLLTNAPRSATVRTLSDCVLLEIPKSVLAPFISTRPEVTQALGRILCERSDALVAIRSRDERRSAASLLTQLTQMIQSCFTHA